MRILSATDGEMLRRYGIDGNSVFMDVTDSNRYDVVEWVYGLGGSASIWRDGRPGLVVGSRYGEVRALPGQIVAHNSDGSFTVCLKTGINGGKNFKYQAITKSAR